MQYNGFKQIRRVAAVILSAVLLVSEIPQAGIVYAAPENGDVSQGQPQSQSQEPDLGSGTTGTKANGAQPGAESGGQSAPGNAAGGTPTVDTQVYEPASGGIDVSAIPAVQSEDEPQLEQESNAYVIKNKDDFLDFIKSPSDYNGKTVRLECDVDLAGIAVGYDGTFAGTFDGKGYSIVDFKTGTGLFGIIGAGASVKNLHISRASIDGSGSVGVIAIENKGTIENCVVTGSLKVSVGMEDAAAGIVAENDGTVKDCVFSGTIEASDGIRIGGIAGINKGIVSACYTAGTVNTTASVIGGIAGANEGTITDSYNYMNVSGKNSVAGIAAENTGSLKSCRNYGDIELVKADRAGQTGGICAKNAGVLQRSYNYGSVKSAVNNAGGIAGYTTAGISECGNFGDVSGAANVAGVAGLYKGTESKDISGCFNKGKVTGNGSGVGGILGSAVGGNPVNITGCWNQGAVINNSQDPGKNFTGNIAGVIMAGKLEGCYGGDGTVAGFAGDGVIGENYGNMDTFTDTEDPDYKCLVIYELGGGHLDKYFDLVNKNGRITRPGDPSKTHGTFGGWYSDSALKSPFDFEGAISGKSVVIYAKWDGSVSVTSFDFRNASATIPKGKTYEIVVDYTPYNAGNKTLKWESENTGIATVAASENGGIVTAVDIGNTLIKASLQDGSLNIVREFSVRVTGKTNEIWIRDANGANIDENPNYGKDIKELDVTVNEPYSVEAVVSGDIASDSRITWESSDESVAAVAADGTAAKGKIAKITGKKSGMARITARYIASSNTVMEAAVLLVNVRPLSDGVSILLGGETVTNSTLIYDFRSSKFVASGSGEGNRLLTPVADLSAKVYPSTAGQKVEWTSSDTGVIEFTNKNSGSFKAKTNGRVKVTATAVDTKKMAVVTIEVKKVAEALTIEPVGLTQDAPVIIDKNGRVALTSGQSIKLKPVYMPADTSEKNVRWKYSGDGKAMKIEADTAEGEWKATAQPVTRETEVTVTAVTLDLGPTGDGAVGTIKFIIKPKVTKVNIYREEDIKNPVNDKNIGLNPEVDRNTFGLRVKNEPENASQVVTWKSSDEKIATIQDNGDGSCVVTVKSKVGKSTITAKAADGSGVTAETTINVTVTVTGITISGSNTVRKGKTIQLTAKVEPASVTNDKVTWESWNPSVAKVDGATGKVTGISAGYATIVAKSTDGGGKEESHSIVVTESIKELRIIDGQPSKPVALAEAEPLNNKSIGIDPDGETGERVLGVYVTPKEACQTVDWKSSDEKIATVGKDGVVTAKGFGSATITATSTDGSGMSASLTVNVTTLSRGVTISGPHYVGIGKTIQLKAEISNKDAANNKVLWSSSNPGAIKVDKNGKVSVASGKKMGNAYIKAEAADGSGKSASHTVYIMDVAEKVDIVGLGGEYTIKTKNKKKYIDVDMKDSEYVAVRLKADLSGGADYKDETAPKEVAWSSSDEKVAKIVESDKLEATVEVYEEGKAIITAKTTDGYSGSKDSCTITVENTNPVVKITGPKQVAVNKKIQLSAGRTLIESWTSSDPYIATVNSKGQVSAKRPGTVYITAEAKIGTHKDKYQVEVRDAVRKIDIAIDDADMSIVTGKRLGADIVGNDLHLLAVIGGEKVKEDSPVGVVWKSDKASVAKVDENGNVEPLKAGTAVITATAMDGSGKKASVTVTVTKQVTKIYALNAALSEDGKAYEARIAKGRSVKLDVGYMPLASTTKKVTWEVAPGDEGYVSVNKNNGTVKALRFISNDKYATVKATATDGGGAVCTFRVYVTNPADKVVVTQEDAAADAASLQRGGTLKEYKANSTVGVDIDSKNKIELGALVTDKDGLVLDNQMLAWKSGNTKIATVDNNGVVTGHKIGKTTMTVSVLDGSKKSCRINIYVGKLVTRIESDKEEFSVRKGKSGDLMDFIVVRPVTATSQKLMFKSKDTKVATVDGKGVVKGKSKGETQIVISTTDGTNIEKIIKVKVN